MILQDVIIAGQWIFLLYFIGLNTGYLLLNVVALFALRRFLEARSIESLPEIYSDFELPISIIVPAYNEAVTICDSVRAQLQLEYGEFEIIVVNDGSSDETLDILIEEFSLKEFPEAYRIRLPTEKVRTIYRSILYRNLKVIDKVNGGKADALNAGINASRYPLFCGVDADSIMQRNSLQRVVQPFLEDPTTIAAGGTIRIANGCKVRHGFIDSIGLPDNKLALFQIVEYLRAFLFGRLGWSPMNALLIISGAFGLFRKETVVAAGGYRTDTIGEDMELVVRLHRMARLSGKPYRITFVPDPICWTEAPTDFKTLGSQRIRWQRGLAESLSANIGLCLHPRGGAAGWLAFPFLLVFELLGPLLEVSGYLFVIIAAFNGWISYPVLLVFLLVAIGLGSLLSASALFLEEMSFRIYPRVRDTMKLFAVAVIENFGYRQLNSVWRLIGLIRWAFGAPARWGKMRRTAPWKQ